MNIIIGKTAGFCFGVKNAVTKAEEYAKKCDNIYCLGELVHNKQVVENLVQNGVDFIEDIKQAKNGNIIFRSHGVEKQIYETAKKMQLKIIDLTCPKVLHIHNIVEEYIEKDNYILITGKKSHPEMIATVSFCKEQYYVIENIENIPQAIKEFEKSGKTQALLISQTTFSLEKFEQIAAKIKQEINTKNIKIINTICTATKQRQEETEKIAKQVETMIIIGGKNSSNSNKLYEIANKNCQNVLFIETEKELETNTIKNTQTIGIMAGASTPKQSITKVIEKLKQMC